MQRESTEGNSSKNCASALHSFIIDFLPLSLSLSTRISSSKICKHQTAQRLLTYLKRAGKGTSMKWKMKEPDELRLCETMVTMRIRLEWKSVSSSETALYNSTVLLLR